MNKYTKRAEEYFDYKLNLKDRTICKLPTCLQVYGGGDNKERCVVRGHEFCNCDWCIEHPTCLRCRLFVETGRYL